MMITLRQRQSERGKVKTMTSHDMLTKKMLHAPHPSGLVFSGPVDSRVGMMKGYSTYIAPTYVRMFYSELFL
jgi:hypothetical protein